MKTGIGIDIGSFSIKLIELKKTRGALEITNCAKSLIKDDSIESCLRELLKGIKLSSKRVNIALSGPSVIVRYLDMPPMSKEELESAIRFEADKYIPFNINEVVIDCAFLDKKEASGRQKVVLVAAKKSIVDNLLELVRKVNLEIASIDIDAFSIFNLFEKKALAKDKDATFALLNLGAKFVNINIIANRNIYFTRDVFWGGIDVTKRIKDALGISLEEAEGIKCDPRDKKEEIRSVIAPVLDKFCLDIRRSFDYFESQFGKSVETIYISGGTSYLFNIVDFLKDRLNANVSIWDSTEGVRMPEALKEQELKTYPSKFCVAFGLAMREI